jgi:hypothetical protein
MPDTPGREVTEAREAHAAWEGIFGEQARGVQREDFDSGREQLEHRRARCRPRAQVAVKLRVGGRGLVRPDGDEEGPNDAVPLQEPRERVFKDPEAFHANDGDGVETSFGREVVDTVRDEGERAAGAPAVDARVSEDLLPDLDGCVEQGAP